MNKMVWGALIVAGISASAAFAQLATYKPGPENVNLPPDYQTNFIRYTTVDRADRKAIRYVYINPEAFNEIKKGMPFPSGTILVLDERPARLGSDGQPLLDTTGRYIPDSKVQLIIVQEKRTGWGVGYPDSIRNGEWEYARFNLDGTRAPGSVEPCMACHLQNRKGEDFTFTLWDYATARR